MKFLIIIPAHNEENNISFCLESLKKQNFQDFVCMIVNDGSTDRTAEIINNFKIQDSRFRVLDLETSEHSPGAKVVRTFDKGLQALDWKDFDVVCKYDADIVFPTNYLEKINQTFETNPKAGIVSGLVYIKKYKSNSEIKNLRNPNENWLDFSNKNGEWVFENLSSKNHVRGPIKAYRKECFEDMNGLRAVLGWDNLDILLAKKHGWDVVTIKDLWVKHLRPTAYKYKSQKAEKLGQYFYNIGLSLPLAMISSAKSSFKNRSAKEFFITINSFLKQKERQNLSTEEIKFIRNLRWKEFFKNFGL
ncbi:glycosyltransferase family 2 protein [Epilithonimonas hominis]|uniref:Glycosyl transferase family 2 n=1 Tax=Epilithonimonas hominis TaxID=420404 RepID=A0A1H6LHI9_9FLAO|nr:glycosyltransferase family 2 protein [Epilithonimonas hominis]ROI14885.1 glycosyltransferase family 2 protein [Epilithonimonas hominis]SEH84236.1 Glycosyl transferase family 2 [Epilithonimonas hominis]